MNVPMHVINHFSPLLFFFQMQLFGVHVVIVSEFWGVDLLESSLSFVNLDDPILPNSGETGPLSLQTGFCLYFLLECLRHTHSFLIGSAKPHRHSSFFFFYFLFVSLTSHMTCSQIQLSFLLYD